MEIPAFKTYDFVPTDEPLQVQAPISEHDEIFVEHSNARTLPKIILAVRIGLGDIVVQRDDEQPLQIRNAAAEINPHLAPVAFRKPVPQLEFYKSVATGLWHCDSGLADNNTRNAHLLRPFAEKLFTFALEKRIKQ